MQSFWFLFWRLATLYEAKGEVSSGRIGGGAGMTCRGKR